MSAFRRLFGYLRRYQRAFVLGLACTVATRAVTLASPKVLQYAVDDLTRGVTQAKLLEYGAALLAIGLVGGAFRFLMRRILTGASRHIEYDMRNDFFAHLEKLPPAYFQAHRTGDLMSRATNDLNAVRMMTGPAVMYSADTLLTFVVALAMMVAIDARLTLYSLIPLPFVSLSVKFFGSAIHRRFEQIQAQLSEVSAVAQEALAGVRVVRAYRQERAEIDRFRQSNEEYLLRNRRLIALQGFFFPSMSFFLGLGALLVIWLGSREVVRGRITVGEFVAFNAYLTVLSWPMIAFGWVTNMVQRGMASWKRMLEVLDSEPAIADCGLRTEDCGSPTARNVRQANQIDESIDQTIRNPHSAIRNVIEFKNLSFAYGERPVLRHVSASIPAGQTIALVGPTGSGKSTLISLLARLHDPPPGTVFVDGVDVRELSLSTLRGTIGFVPQEPFLFSDTLADNVAFGLDGIAAIAATAAIAPIAASAPAAAAGAAGQERPGREETVLAAAAVARLDKDVADFPKGYDTVVGERGITLSGGQKQRTALARAVAIDPRILILDDALSAVDTYTEEEILTRLQAVMRERTSIIVSHRISTVRRADQILVLDDGRIVERGTHDELVARNGLYAEMHKKQLLEEELAAS
ncbi:MAG TPA: ABC transporter ATP-binding protein [Vicinamibacterales bacterium]|jgi:ATP-binding cassette subfamily B protein|nr:ABC transporter ATP-binding protein [Vicinamibacterales bacterium]